MSSSDRIVGRLPGRRPVPDPGGPVDAPRPGIVVRARPDGRSSAPPAPAGLVPGAGAAAFSAPGALVGGAPGDLRVDIRRVHRIAEERGYAAGRSQAEAELRAAIEAAGAVAARLEAAAPRDTITIAHTIVEVALTVARRILDAEVSADPTILARALEGAVGQVNGSPVVRIFLHPDAVLAVRDAWEAVHGRAHLGKEWSFEADPTLPPGGCVLRHEHGFVDAGLEAQLEEIGIALDRTIPSLARPDGAESAA